ncbi:serine/threonine protein kinase [Streptomyces sp. MA5143a]|uniref:serine/threonine protein kinase n=1 Tax=Streptomyces sp. MA5143a TaxID=2083010 RepID=UPI000D1A9D04|nr:serine/threonine-protein kinase [Streptomyces sp. MA5143a]SPF06725.1 Serine/threonine-protein kinase PrkC [Streptomyces sp. MA5143a]
MVEARVSTDESIAGRYRLIDVVHRETNRVSWRGEDVREGLPCLVTRVGLPAHLGQEEAVQAADRVVRMSETMARVSPGRVAPVLDALTEAGSLWTVTEWIDGLPLDQLVDEEGPFDPAMAATVALQLLDVLEAAHGEGITHGELSPGQVFLRAHDHVVVTGFGLAGATLVPRLAAPSYASPEQARDERIGPAADLWALGAILYTMLEGRPPYRDPDWSASNPQGATGLPLGSTLREGPLAATVQGLLREDSWERLTRTTVRQSLNRVLEQDPHAVVAASRLRRAWGAARRLGPRRSGRAMAAGTALAVVMVAVAALAVTHRLPHTEETAGGGAQTRPPVSTAPAAEDAGEPVDATPRPSDASSGTPSSPAPTASAAPSPPAASVDALPEGYRVYRAPEGFSVALPNGWKRLSTRKQGDVAYRVTFGSDGDPRTLAVTYSTRAGSDPVAVWRDDVEPALRLQAGFQRIGAIEATTYQGYEAADMEWFSDTDGRRGRTFGRGFLLGGHRSFSLRWTTPSADWDKAANRQALETFLVTFRPDPAP